MEAQNRKVQYWIALAVALCTMTASASFAWTTPVIPKFHNNETKVHVTDTEITWVVLSTYPGMIVGSIGAQYQSDRIGRRCTLLLSTIPFIIGTMFMLCATKVWMIYLAKSFWSLGAATVQNVATIYVAEIASKEIRGRLIVGNRFFFNMGSFLIVAIGSFVSFHILSLMLIVLPVMYFIACWWIPESPYYLLKEDNVDTARKVLKKLHGCTDKIILEEKLSAMVLHVNEDMQRSTTLKELFTGKQYRKALIISYGLRLLSVMSGTIPISHFLGRIIQETGSVVAVSTGLLTYATVRFLSCIFASLLVDNLGRRPLLICSFFGSFLSFLVIGSCCYIREVINIDKYNELTAYIIFIGLVCFIAITTIGFGTLIYAIPAEIFPLNVKSIAMTTINLFGSFITFIVISMYQVVKYWTGLYGVFWIFGVMSFMGAVFSYIVVPETKGKSLREIQMELQGPYYEGEREKVDLKTEEEIKLTLASEQTED